MNLVLTPVVEFCPSNYSTSDHPYPNTSSAQSPEAWDTYWRTCLKDAGIVNLEPFETASQLVPVHHLHDEHVLDALLRAELGDVDEWHADFLSPLEGGYVLSASESHLKPGCCGSLANLEDWRRAAEHQAEDWAMVWIGHPWTHVSAKADTLTILHPSDENLPVDPKVFCHASREVLKAAIESAAETLSAFGERLRPSVAAMNPTLPVDDVLEVLLRGHSAPA